MFYCDCSGIIAAIGMTKKLIQFTDGRGLSNILIYIIVGCSIVVITGIAVVVVVICCKRSPDTPDRKKGYVTCVRYLFLIIIVLYTNYNHNV